MQDSSIQTQQLETTKASSGSLLRPDLIATSMTLNISDTLRDLQITVPDSASTLPPDFDIAKLSLNAKQQFLLDKIIEKFQKLNQAKFSDDHKKELTIQIINSFFIIYPTEKCKLSQEELVSCKFSEIIFIYQPSNSRLPFKLFKKDSLITLLNQDVIHSREIYDPPANKDFILFFEANPQGNFQLFSINFLDCLAYKELLKNAIRGNFGDLNSKIYFLLNKENDIFYKLIKNPKSFSCHGNPFLYYAIEHNNLSAVNNFLSIDMRVNIGCLHHAISKYHSFRKAQNASHEPSHEHNILLIIDSILLKHKMDVLQLAHHLTEGLIPLKYAIKYDLETLITKLIKARPSLLDVEDLDKIISKNLLESFQVAYYLNKFDLVKYFYTLNHSVTGRLFDRLSIFQLCVKNNKLEFIKFLLSVDENLIQSLTENGLNIIELAARHCNIEIFNFLKEKFIESKPRSYKEGELIATQSASRIACLSLLNNENFNVCQYLITHLFATRKLFFDDPTYSPLKHAILSGNLILEKIKLLMECGLNLETELSKEYEEIDSYPIYLSLSSKDLNVIKYFFNYLFQIKNGDLSKIFDIFNKSEVLKETSDIDQLLFFHKEFHSEIIKKLNKSLKIEFYSISLLNMRYIADRELSYLQSIFFLVIYSIKYDINSIKSWDEYSSTDKVDNNNQDKANRILQEYSKIYDQEGSDYSILLLSGIFNDWRLLEFLIENGSKIDKKTPKGFTIFDLALLKADCKSIKYLIEKFNEQLISIFTSTDHGYNPISLLAKNPNLSLNEFKEIFEIFTQQSSNQPFDPNQADRDGNSILHNALNSYQIKLQNYFSYREIPANHEEKFEEGASFEEDESRKSKITRFNELITYQISISDPQLINQKNNEGKSIFELAIEFTILSKSNDIVFKLLEFENIEIPDQLPKAETQEEKLDETLSKKILACKITKIINDKNIDDSEETSNEEIANKIANFITVNDLHYLEEVGDNLVIKIIESSDDDIEEKVVIIPKEISAILREKYQIIKPSVTQESELLTVDLEVDKDPSTSPESSKQEAGSQLGKRKYETMQET